MTGNGPNWGKVAGHGGLSGASRRVNRRTETERQATGHAFMATLE